MTYQERLHLFTAQIQKGYGLNHWIAERNAREVLSELPPRLLPNVEEWSLGRKLTDIRIGDYSISRVLALWGNADFLGAARVMSLMEKDPARALQKIQGRR